MLEDILKQAQAERNQVIDAQAEACIEASKEIEQVVYNLKKFLGGYIKEDIGWVQTNCTDLDDYQPWAGQTPDGVCFRMSTLDFKVTGRVIIDVHAVNTFLKIGNPVDRTHQVGNNYISNAINNIGDCAVGLAKKFCPYEMDPKKLTHQGKQY
jgi:hypothetical protein